MIVSCSHAGTNETGPRRVRVFAPVAVPRASIGSWMLIRCGLAAAWSGFVATVDLLDRDGRVRNGPFEFRAARNGRLEAIAFAATDVTACRVTVLGRLPDGTETMDVAVRRMTRSSALLRLARREPGGVRRLLGAFRSPNLFTLATRLRALGLALVVPGLGPRSYREWLDAFETWSAAELPARPDDPDLLLLVFRDRPASAALDATFASLRSQSSPANWRAVGPNDDLRDALGAPAAGPHAYVGLLQAGEILPPHAVSLAFEALRSAGYPEIAIADEDEIGLDGRRRAPDFRPTPNLPMMLSGVLSRGLWLVRRDALERFSAARRRTGPWAEPVRLALWLAGRAAGRPNGIRIPHLLSSRRPDVERAPGDLVERVVADFLAASGLPLRARAGTRAVALRHDGVSPLPSVTAVVPSILVAPHAERCLSAILAGTDYPGFDMLIALSGPAEPGEAVRRVASRLAEIEPTIRVRHYRAATFNFAEIVNRAAAETASDLILVLNDDVTPVDPTWLADMASWFADPRVCAVGARLLYPDLTIQHGGVLLGPATLCYHAFLGMDAQAPDLPLRATLPQQMLAVTGACLLVRAATWRALGGMDPAYPSGFNDVDFCLRASESGCEVILSDATLIHEESRTFGSHWSGERAAFHRIEVERMQRRWRAYVADDPFYNPNLDLDVERAWQPVWPPRRATDPASHEARTRAPLASHSV